MTDQDEQWGRSYSDSLKAHLESTRSRDGVAARTVARELLRAGCNPPTLARLHQRAVVELAPAFDLATFTNGLHRRTTKFFTEALLTLAAHGRSSSTAGKSGLPPAEALRLAATELAQTKRRLKREIVRRETCEQAVTVAEKRYQQLHKQSAVMQTKLRSLAHQLLGAQEQERREISRELHDEVVQTLVGINVELSALSKAASIGTRTLRSKIMRTQRLVEKSVTAVHQFARDLRPAVLDDLGLIPALKTFMHSISARHKLSIRLTAFAGVEAIPDPRRIVLYRVAQEALTNVARHAKANVVKVSIKEVGGAIHMEIHDDGKSFRVAQTMSGRSNKRLGLVGMRERVEMVGGTLTITSAPGEGTTVHAVIPLSPGGAS